LNATPFALHAAGLSCSIYINNARGLLNQSQIRAMEGILSAADADVSVDTSLTSADIVFRVNVAATPGSLGNPNIPSDAKGYTARDGDIMTNNSWVFATALNNLGAELGVYNNPLRKNPNLLGRGAGRVGVHEFLHFMLQVDNSGHVPGTPFQGEFTASQYFGGPNSVWVLSKSQIAAIQGKCGQKSGPYGGGGTFSGPWVPYLYDDPMYWNGEMWAPGDTHVIWVRPQRPVVM